VPQILNRKMPSVKLLAALAAAAILMPSVAYAYIGPGAGFAFLTSFLVLFATFFLAFIFFLTWPIRFAIKKIKHRGKGIKGDVDRVIVVGFDGLDPDILEDLMSKQKLPNIAGLIER